MEIGFKLDLDIAAKQSQGGRLATGVYEVEIVKNYLHKTDNGNNVLDLELRSKNGEVGFVNRLCIDATWSSGAENFDYPKWQELAASCQMQTLTTFASKRNTKDGEIDALSIKELTGKVIQVALYQEFDVYNNEETVKLKIANTFLADGRSITEAQAGKPAERIKKTAERLTDFYTPEHKAWKGGGVTTAAIDNVGVADVAPEVAPLPEVTAENAANLFG